ncbi:MAG: hypothetical protein WDZ86_03425 [Gammaproteobacteria bacterium]
MINKENTQIESVRAPFYIRSIKIILVFSIVYLISLFAIAKINNINYGQYTYTLFWLPAYVINIWIIGFMVWLQKKFELPLNIYAILIFIYFLFLCVGLGYDWLMISAGTWYFDEQSIFGIILLQGQDLYGNQTGVPLEELVFDITFLPFGFLVVLAALFQYYDINILLQKGNLDFKVLFSYAGFLSSSNLRIYQVDDIDVYMAAYDPTDDSKCVHLIRKNVNMI